jgi:RNA polymerase sigma-70 factor (ECF subfamily)
MTRKQQITDRDLVKKYLNGDESSLGVLINRHRNRIFGAIVVFVKDANLANDIFQDTFIKVIKTLRSGNYKEEGKFLPWVLRIAHNLCVDHFRKSKRAPKFSGSDEFDIFDVLKLDEANVEEEMAASETHDKVRRLLQELPEDQKEVVIMRHYAGLSFKEIAENTDVSINTALGRMRYALINMRKLIEERNIQL